MGDNSIFKVGNVVQLKSGGEKMTVVQLEQYRLGANSYIYTGYVVCSWFKDDNLLKEKFHEDSLKLFSENA